jgi:DNA-binding transcriptional LysR family regulator
MAIGASQEGPVPHRLSVGYRSEPLGSMPLAFAVAPTHPLAALPSPVALAEIRRHRQVVVGDTSQQLAPRTSGLLGAVDVLAVPTMSAKIQAQIAGLGCGYLPLARIRGALARGELVVRETDQGERSTVLSVAWRHDARGRAVAWWIDSLRNSATRAALVA